MNNYSFYGGRPGQSFNIAAYFPTVEEMNKAFGGGGAYTTVNYGEYALIYNAKDPRGVDHGSLYRRDLQGATFVGRISGPAGYPPHVKIVPIQEVLDKINKIKEDKSNSDTVYGSGSYLIIPDGDKFDASVCACRGADIVKVEGYNYSKVVFGESEVDYYSYLTKCTFTFENSGDNEYPYHIKGVDKNLIQTCVSLEKAQRPTIEYPSKMTSSENILLTAKEYDNKTGFSLSAKTVSQGIKYLHFQKQVKEGATLFTFNRDSIFFDDQNLFQIYVEVDNEDITSPIPGFKKIKSLEEIKTSDEYKYLIVAECGNQEGYILIPNSDNKSSFAEYVASICYYRDYGDTLPDLRPGATDIRYAYVSEREVIPLEGTQDSEEVTHEEQTTVYIGFSFPSLEQTATAVTGDAYENAVVARVLSEAYGAYHYDWEFTIPQGKQGTSFTRLYVDSNNKLKYTLTSYENSKAGEATENEVANARWVYEAEVLPADSNKEYSRLAFKDNLGKSIGKEYPIKEVKSISLDGYMIKATYSGVVNGNKVEDITKDVGRFPGVMSVGFNITTQDTGGNHTNKDYLNYLNSLTKEATIEAALEKCKNSGLLVVGGSDDTSKYYYGWLNNIQDSTESGWIYLGEIINSDADPKAIQQTVDFGDQKPSTGNIQNALGNVNSNCYTAFSTIEVGGFLLAVGGATQ